MSCPECGSLDFIFKRDTAEVICGSCGYVVGFSDRMVSNPIVKEEEPKPLRGDPEKIRDAKRLMEWATQGTAFRVGGEIVRLCEAIGLPKPVLSKAMEIYRRC